MGKTINRIANWLLRHLPQDAVEQYARDKFELFTEDEFMDGMADRAEQRRECMG